MNWSNWHDFNIKVNWHHEEWRVSEHEYWFKYIDLKELQWNHHYQYVCEWSFNCKQNNTKDSLYECLMKHLRCQILKKLELLLISK